MRDLVGWYTGDSVDLPNALWKDISGANSKALIDDNDASFISTTGADVDAATNPLNEFYINDNPVLTGETTTQLTFGPPVSREFTVFNLCKYKNAGTQRRIIQAEEYNSVMGFDVGKSGISCITNWITSDQDRFGDNWVLSTNQASLYRGNDIDFSNGNSGNPVVSRLTINRGDYAAQTSSFGCSEIIIINKEISESEIECVEDYLSDKYGFIATGNPGNCLTEAQKQNLVGWYDGDSADIANSKWYDLSGLENDALIDGDFEIFDGQDPLNEFYANGNKVVTAGTSTTFTFEPLVSYQHTVFNLVCLGRLYLYRYILI